MGMITLDSFLSSSQFNQSTFCKYFNGTKGTVIPWKRWKSRHVFKPLTNLDGTFWHKWDMLWARCSCNTLLHAFNKYHIMWLSFFSFSNMSLLQSFLPKVWALRVKLFSTSGPTCLPFSQITCQGCQTIVFIYLFVFVARHILFSLRGLEWLWKPSKCVVMFS